jgi:hypothetical protein
MPAESIFDVLDQYRDVDAKLADVYRAIRRSGAGQQARFDEVDAAMQHLHPADKLKGLEAIEEQLKGSKPTS